MVVPSTCKLPSIVTLLVTDKSPEIVVLAADKSPEIVALAADKSPSISTLLVIETDVLSADLNQNDETNSSSPWNNLPANLISPSTSSFLLGLFVPIPTLPNILTFPLPCILNKLSSVALPTLNISYCACSCLITNAGFNVSLNILM